MKDLRKNIDQLLSELKNNDGSLAIEKYSDFSAVHQKKLELEVVLQLLTPQTDYLLNRLEREPVFASQDISQSLKTLVIYCETVKRLFEKGILDWNIADLPPQKIEQLTTALPNLEKVIIYRWKEVQRCLNAGAYLSALIIMGSILEALLLARVNQNEKEIYRSTRAPRDKKGRPKPLHLWSLSELIIASIEQKWITLSPRSFHTSLRKYRDLIHPWAQISAGMRVDGTVAHKSWYVLNQVIEQLLKSL
ncbi:MAG: hypothetical protein D6748_02445 [Calditrichaeota bacterium]|nr:MAG: hypothetical protein D6748_02445 [Calditrichota bacterium]